MADRKPLKVLPDDGGDSTGLGEFINTDTVGVGDGGTGASTLTANGILLGNGTSAVAASAAMTTNGTLLIGGTGGPEVATLTAGSNITLTNGDGAITIAAAGGLDAANGLDNRIATFSDADSLNGEANLTFDGTTLNVVGNGGVGIARTEGTLHVHTATAGSVTANTIADDLVVENNGNMGISLLGPDANDKYIYFGSPSTNNIASIGANYNSGTELLFFTTAGAERLRIDDTGNVKVSDGDLVIGTSGHGIDFSAHAHASGMTSELLDDYEEGTFTPDCQYDNTSYTNASNSYGTYVKIGQMVYFNIVSQISNPSAVDGNEKVYWRGLPFTSHAGNSGANQYEYSTHDCRIQYFDEANAYPAPWIGPNNDFVTGWKAYDNDTTWDHIYTNDIHRSSGSNNFVITGSYRAA
jgi:hypothetical protein